MLTEQPIRTAREKRADVFLTPVRNAEIIIALGLSVRSVHQKLKFVARLGVVAAKKVSGDKLTSFRRIIGHVECGIVNKGLCT